MSRRGARSVILGTVLGACAWAQPAAITIDYPAGAITPARRALDLAARQDKRPLAEALKARLALYEARTPFRAGTAR